MFGNLTPEVAESFGADRRSTLYWVLQRLDRPLIFALLPALHHLSDGGALVYVEKLADGRALAAQDTQDTAIRDLAAAVLPTIRQQAEQHRSNTMLLRASSADSSLAATALRPVIEAPDNRNQELLRASETDA
jgi:hypothetical protein